MKKALILYRDSYYALVHLSYDYKIKWLSNDYELWDSAQSALVFFILCNGMIALAIYRLVLVLFINQPINDIICWVIFLAPAILNYYLLFDKEKYTLYVDNKKQVPKSAYNALFLLFALSFFSAIIWFSLY